MKIRNQTDGWIFYTTFALGSILVLSVAGMAILIFMKHSNSELLVAMGIVAGAGLAKLIISPWYPRLIE